MRIIKTGITDPNWTQQVTCGSTMQQFTAGCGAVLEVGLDDLYMQGSRNGRGAAAYCCCPSCGHRIEVCDIKFFITRLPYAEDWEAARPEIVAAAEAAQTALNAARQALMAK